MILEESLLIKKILMKIPIPKEVLDIGSATHDYRTSTQPYIDNNVFHPLRRMKSKITYLDIKKRNGIDIGADISSTTFSVPHKYDLVLCTSVLEYVKDIKTSINNISSAVIAGGYLIITTPLKYPYHDAPFDTLNRYSPDDLKKLFSEYSFKILYTTVLRHNISFKDWIKLCVESFIQIFQWRHFSALLWNIIQCRSREMKFTFVLLRAEPTISHRY